MNYEDLKKVSKKLNLEDEQTLFRLANKISTLMQEAEGKKPKKKNVSIELLDLANYATLLALYLERD